MANEDLKEKISLKKQELQNETERIKLEKELKTLSMTNKPKSNLVIIGKSLIKFLLFSGKMFMKIGEAQNKKYERLQKKDKKRNKRVKTNN